jgi:hypothetical protein
MVVKDYSCHSSNISSRNVNQNSTDKNFLSMEVEDVIDKKQLFTELIANAVTGQRKSMLIFI